MVSVRSWATPVTAGDVDAGLGPQRLRAPPWPALSAYQLPADLAGTAGERRVWVITDDVEDPDTATTILWPSDY